MSNSDIKLICFDLNKTLINENTWVDLNLAMGMTKEEDDILFNLYEEGIISYMRWQKIIEKIYLNRGKSKKKIIENVIYKYTYKKGAKQIVKYLIKKCYKVALISSSIDLLVKRGAGELNIELYNAGNKLIFDNKDNLIKLKCLGEEKSVKLKQLKEFCKRLKIKITECACVGDGDNDRKLFEVTGKGITFKGSKIEKAAWKVIDDLSQIKDVL